jgi:hypothetical protein
MDSMRNQRQYRRRGTTRCGPRADSGFVLLDVLVGAIVLAIALLGHAATVLTSHRLDQTVENRGDAVVTLEKFVDRLRSDPDWDGLYARLCDLSAESAGDATLSVHSVDPTLPTHAPTDYYSDFVTPIHLGTVTVLVQVPTIERGGVTALREDAEAPRYGLPSDLDGDGVVDGDSRNDDYQSLPVVVRLRWQRAGEGAQEVVLATWLRGER